MAFLFILGGLCVNAAELTINFNTTDFGKTNTTYVTTAFDFTKDGVTFNTNQVNPSTGQVKVNQGNATTASGNFYIYNVTAIPNISKVEIKMVSGSAIAASKSNLVSIRTADAKITDSSCGTDLSSISGTTLTLVPSATDKSFFRIDLAKIGGTVKFESMTIYYGDVVPSEPIAYEPNFADVELWEGKTAALNLGNKYPTDIIFVSENESVATVSDKGVITAVGAGETTVSVTWDADENFLAPAEPITFNVVVKGLPEGSQFESITGANFADISGNTYAKYSVSTDFADYTVITTDLNLPNITWNRGNKNVGKDSGIVFKAKDGYYPIWVTVESNWNNSQDMNLYLSNDELTLAGLGTAATAGVITKDASTYVINGEYKYIGIRPSADKSIQLIKLTILWGKAETPAIEFPSFGEAEHSFTTESSEIRIADADHAFDIFYLHTPAPAVEAYAEGDADNFENKAEFDDENGEHVIPVSESGTLSYYAVHTATGTQGATETVKVTKTATTAIDAIGADAAEGEAEYFDIRGVKVNIDNAAPGLYIRRQGTTATKVIVK